MGAEMARKGLRAPVNVTWEITLRCNLRCTHCLSNAGLADNDEMSTAECKRLIDQLISCKVFQVNIGGGEPFLREDFFDLLTHAHEKGLVTCVSTNGIMVDDDLAKSLSELDLLYLQVSLDGATSDVNDRIRGEGTYRAVVAAMDCLARWGVKFSVNTVLTRLNFLQLEALRALAKGYGAELRVSRFRPSGRGRLSKDSIGPDHEQLEIFAEWLEAHDMVRTGDSFFCLTSEKRRNKGLDMCGAAKMTCCISPTGDLYPCAFLQESPFLAGNVRHESLSLLWRRSPILQQFRDLDMTSCQTCVRYEDCRGGCPAMAYHTYHDIRKPDPECLVNLRTTSNPERTSMKPLNLTA